MAFPFWSFSIRFLLWVRDGRHAPKGGGTDGWQLARILGQEDYYMGGEALELGKCFSAAGRGGAVATRAS